MERFNSDFFSEVHGIPTTASDLEKLISLAENVSDNLEDMYSKKTAIKQKTSWTIGLSYVLLVGSISFSYFYSGSFLSFNSSFDLLFAVGILILSVPFFIFFVTMNDKFKRLRNDIMIEDDVLAELLDIIHELENAGRYHSMIDPVTIAVLRIRLKRVHFKFK